MLNRYFGDWACANIDVLAPYGFTSSAVACTNSTGGVPGGTIGRRSRRLLRSGSSSALMPRVDTARVVGGGRGSDAAVGLARVTHCGGVDRVEERP